MCVLQIFNEPQAVEKNHATEVETGESRVPRDDSQYRNASGSFLEREDQDLLGGSLAGVFIFF